MDIFTVKIDRYVNKKIHDEIHGLSKVVYLCPPGTGPQAQARARARA